MNEKSIRKGILFLMALMAAIPSPAACSSEPNGPAEEMYNITAYNISGYNISGYNISGYNNTVYNAKVFNATTYNANMHNATDGLNNSESTNDTEEEIFPTMGNA
ncbi:hypothetical protein, partial [Methanothrix sp.]|uniref:hypothetical protein n=1 Tax=Methanothrix sp. TaxID=90426 RepID=UPI003BAF63A0